LHEAAKFLNQRSPGKGDEFLQAFLRALEVLKQFPAAGGRIQAEFRRLVISRWHHSIVYTVSHATIFVIAVVDDARGPEYWRNRVK
jgi:plasmid stabilization system protein ParE